MARAKGFPARDRARSKLLEYLADPNNDFLTRQELSTRVLGYKNQNQLNCLFTADELQEIEREALELRRKKYAPRLSKIDRAILERAEKGDPVAARLAYKRFEGWTETARIEQTGKDGGPIEQQVTHDLTPEALEVLRELTDGDDDDDTAGTGE